MPTVSENNKLIAKNTLVLYIRMFFMLVINLYTSRVVLQILGVTDYGVFNAVGGIVSLFSILSSALTNSIMRFLSFELGKKDIERQKQVFTTSINVMLMLSGLVILIGETLGLWFLNNKMDIPDIRLVAANWVFQGTILIFIINLISIPYNASIISHERMSVFAYISIFEAILKLSLIFCLNLIHFDKLITYTCLLVIIASVIRFIYGFYCKRNFDECSYSLYFNKELFKQITEFAGWNFLGRGARVVNEQGVNLLMNIFFGVYVNAARGIAVQVQGAAVHFVTNFTTALNPQIIKSYSDNKIEYMHSLIYRGAKLSYFLMLLVSLPICFETGVVLEIWLGQVPDYSVDFVRFTLIVAMIDVVNGTIITGLHATGNLKKCMTVIGCVEISCFVLTYISFIIGFSPIAAYIVHIFVYMFLMFLRVYLIKDLISMRFYDYAKNVFHKLFIVTLVASIPPLMLSIFMKDGFLRMVVLSLVSCVFTMLSIYLFGLTRNEKMWINNILLTKIQYYKNRK